MNLAAFYNKFDDLQCSAFDGAAAGFLVGNAPEATSRGVEADAVMLLTESLTLRAALAYLDASYDSFPGAVFTAQQIDDWTGEGSCVQDLRGEPLQFSPEWSGNLSLEYFVPPTERLEMPG